MAISDPPHAHPPSLVHTLLRLARPIFSMASHTGLQRHFLQKDVTLIQTEITTCTTYKELEAKKTPLGSQQVAKTRSSSQGLEMGQAWHLESQTAWVVGRIPGLTPPTFPMDFANT